VVIAVVVALTLVLTDGDSSSANHRASASPTSIVTGARLADPDEAIGFIAGATSDVVAVTTYDYRSLDDALNAGLAVTTGAYRTAYRQALTGPLAATAKKDHVIHSFELLKVGIGEINAAGTEAKVLVFGTQQAIDDATGNTGASSPVTLCATMQRLGNRYLISDLVADADAGLPPGGPQLIVAAQAARTEVMNVLSYRRAQFDADQQRAQGGATSPLSEQIERDAAATQAAMIKGKYDLNGTLSAVAVESAADASATLLLAGNSNKLSDAGVVIGTSPVRYEVTVNQSGGRWVASHMTAVSGG
jgi:hypothetical protein